MLQPFDYDPQEKNKHKFMVQTMFAPDGPVESQDQLVSDILHATCEYSETCLNRYLFGPKKNIGLDRLLD